MCSGLYNTCLKDKFSKYYSILHIKSIFLSFNHFQEIKKVNKIEGMPMVGLLLAGPTLPEKPTERSISHIHPFLPEIFIISAYLHAINRVV